MAKRTYFYEGGTLKCRVGSRVYDVIADNTGKHPQDRIQLDETEESIRRHQSVTERLNGGREGSDRDGSDTGGARDEDRPGE